MAEVSRMNTLSYSFLPSNSASGAEVCPSLNYIIWLEFSRVELDDIQSTWAERAGEIAVSVWCDDILNTSRAWRVLHENKKVIIKPSGKKPHTIVLILCGFVAGGNWCWMNGKGDLDPLRCSALYQWWLELRLRMLSSLSCNVTLVKKQLHVKVKFFDRWHSAIL